MLQKCREMLEKHVYSRILSDTRTERHSKLNELWVVSLVRSNLELQPDASSPRRSTKLHPGFVKCFALSNCFVNWFTCTSCSLSVESPVPVGALWQILCVHKVQALPDAAAISWDLCNEISLGVGYQCWIHVEYGCKMPAA